jgi:hypothetical protein
MSRVPRILIQTWLLLLTSFVIAATPDIHHQSPAAINYNQFSKLTCIVEEPDGLQIKTVKIFIRNTKKELFSEFNMYNDDGVYTFQIIPEMARADSFYYFITAEFSDFSIQACPENNPEDNPIALLVVQPQRTARKISAAEVAKIFCDLGRSLNDIQSVTIYTRYQDKGAYSDSPMKLSEERFQYAVSSPTAKNQSCYYYILIEFTDHSIISYPSSEFDEHGGYRVFQSRR